VTTTLAGPATLRHWIGGRFDEAPAERYADVTNPVTGAVIARVPRGSAADLDRAVATAKTAFPSWRDASLARRSQVLFAFRDLVFRHQRDLAALVVSDHGKTFPDALGGVARGLEVIDFACGIPSHLIGGFSESVSTNVDTVSWRQPLGVVACITPFNFPVMVPMWMYPLALACGNAVVLKPSSDTPMAIGLQAELLAQAGLPAGIFNVLYGGRETVGRILEHPDIAAVSFVGSTDVGAVVYETGARHGKRVAAYTGAKNHMVVLPDADIELAADSAVSAGYGSAGERCMAIAVVVAVGDAGDRLVPLLVDRIRRLRVGDGMADGTDMGPLYSRAHRDNVAGYIAKGVAEGATLVIDGRELRVPEHPDGFFLGPTLFDHVGPEMTIYQDEIFGPVLCVTRVDTYDQAVELINRNQWANGTAIFTNDGGMARRFQREIEVGMVGINVPIPVPVGYYPFGGWRRSMFGDLDMKGEEGVRFYTRAKTVTSRWPEPGIRGVSLGFPQNT
jgi:malonate-semialdehyde dehydrogenase (acetylating) / methylmalonate-semialdehyde dehydrogenase